MYITSTTVHFFEKKPTYFNKFCSKKVIHAFSKSCIHQPACFSTTHPSWTPFVQHNSFTFPTDDDLTTLLETKIQYKEFPEEKKKQLIQRIARLFGSQEKVTPYDLSRYVSFKLSQLQNELDLGSEHHEALSKLMTEALKECSINRMSH